MVHSDELIFPYLKHLSLGENVIIDSLSSTDEGGIYTLQPKFNIFTSAIKLSSPTTLCIDWPETYDKERSSDPDDGGSLIDWFVPELLHNLDENTCNIKEIKVHVRYNNIGHLIFKIMGYGPGWRPKSKLDMVNMPGEELKGIIQHVFWSVVNAMNGLIEEDLHFDSTMIGEPFSFFLLDDEGNKDQVIEEVLEEVTDDYEALYDTVQDATTWKSQDNEDEWKCRCGRHIPDWKATNMKRRSPTPEVEVMDHTQRKIDEYFKPLKNNSQMGEAWR
ncbi:hypothetical protein I203_105477 [Kwoniella mangroviensis CBS 8507]|uniref:uncharacterized protein n=1 Tax=Kwoniella mangroviensis CBS 8507 TaxID=1296122 RepID=UPI00080D2016|nr:uncharacterized protein I203_01287 [Kwoniella mangroviensis CBS 8507]OCF69430.1 hypothetical protein I203_01287 [Kwoniella mangroviensis CBS 8507]